MTTTTLTTILVLVYPGLSLIVTGSLSGVNWAAYGTLSAVLIGVALAVFSRSGYQAYVRHSTPNFLNANIFLGFVSYCSLAWGSVIAYLVYKFTDNATWKDLIPVCSNISYVIFALVFAAFVYSVKHSPDRYDWN